MVKERTLLNMLVNSSFVSELVGYVGEIKKLVQVKNKGFLIQNVIFSL